MLVGMEINGFVLILHDVPFSVVLAKQSYNFISLHQVYDFMHFLDWPSQYI